MKSFYKDQVVHFFGGVHEYLGEIDQKPHKMGEGWWRILSPCMIMRREHPEKKSIEQIVISLRGVGKAYKRYVDIYLPSTEPIEIRTLDKGGTLYNVYKTEVDRKDPERIVTPDAADIQRVVKFRGINA